MSRRSIPSSFKFKPCPCDCNFPCQFYVNVALWYTPPEYKTLHTPNKNTICLSFWYLQFHKTTFEFSPSFSAILDLSGVNNYIILTFSCVVTMLLMFTLRWISFWKHITHACMMFQYVRSSRNQLISFV